MLSIVSKRLDSRETREVPADSGEKCHFASSIESESPIDICHGGELRDDELHLLRMAPRMWAKPLIWLHCSLYLSTGIECLILHSPVEHAAIENI